MEMITKHCGMTYSGMGPDFRLLVRNARKIAQQYFMKYNEEIPVSQLVQRVANVMQEYTHSGFVDGIDCVRISMFFRIYKSTNFMFFSTDRESISYRR